MDFSNLFGVPFKFIVIKTNNYCNLSCEYCNNLCDSQISRTSSNIFRLNVFNVDKSDLIKYCESLKGVGEADWHRLSGGEPTSMNDELFGDIVDILHTYNRKIELMTNGYNVFGIDRYILDRISAITLDKHGINSEHVDNCIDYLRSFYKEKISIINQNLHYDLTKAQKFECNQGKSCENWLSTLTLYKRVIFPCCVMFPLMLYKNSMDFYNILEKSGWTIDNKSIIQTMENHEVTIPKEIVNECLYNCWNPHFIEKNGVHITKKFGNVIRAK